MRGSHHGLLVVVLSGCVLAGHPLAAQDAPVARRAGNAAPVVVLPFSNITGDASDDWIGEGIAESLTTDLLRDAALGVIARERVAETMRRLEGGRPAAEPDRAIEIGRRVGARWLISGAYQRLGSQIRITGRFVEVATGRVVRSAKVDGALDQLFELQDRVVAELTTAAAPRLAGGVVPRAVPPRAAAPGGPPAGAETPRPAAADPRPPAAVVSPAAVTPPAAPGAAGAPTTPGSVADVGFSVAGGAALLGAIDGPPPPVPPEVISRDEEGRATIRAIRLTEGIRLDGQLDEPVYHTVPAITGFIQQIPDEGAPATEPTEAWVMFDETNIYLAARCYDSAPESEWVADEMRRDTAQLRQNDTFAVILDTFYDRRNGVAFYTNPLGALADFALTNEGNPNSDWNPVWDVRTGRFDGGWTVEMQIPFKSLRYRPGPSPLWGFQLRRVVRRKNEGSYITPLPISAARGGAIGGIFRVSDAATLVGLEVPRGSRNFEVKPYGIGGVTTDVNALPAKDNDGDGDFGLDVKYGITQNLTADFTYNTDFAQVEVDEQQVNLTRFSLFFPEKREFFLEGRGIFDFARGGVGGGGGGRGGGGGGFFGGGNAPTLFYSRRIGLQSGQIVPILGGGRVTGKVGPFDVGALSIQSDAEEISGAAQTNFTVVRVKRDILRRSSIGALFTNRSVSTVGDGSNQAYGVDGTFAFYDNISVIGYFAKTQTPGVSGQDTSYQGRFDYAGDRYGLGVEHLVVGDNFIPEVGFLRRDDFRRTYVQGRFSPRPRSIERVRQFRFEGSLDYILTADTNILETRQNQLRFQTELENSDRLGVTLNDNYELLETPFAPGPDVTIPVGGYDFQDVELSYSLGQQRRINGTVSLQTGSYFTGDITTLGFRRGRVAVTRQLSVEPSISFNWIDTPQGSFRTDLVVARVNYTFSPRMFFSGLVQYNSSTDTISNNLRLRWEYSPGSELFVVYTEDRDTTPLRPDRISELRNRGFVVKFNRLFRF